MKCLPLLVSILTLNVNRVTRALSQRLKNFLMCRRGTQFGRSQTFIEKSTRIGQVKWGHSSFSEILSWRTSHHEEIIVCCVASSRSYHIMPRWDCWKSFVILFYFRWFLHLEMNITEKTGCRIFLFVLPIFSTAVSNRVIYPLAFLHKCKLIL